MRGKTILFVLGLALGACADDDGAGLKRSCGAIYSEIVDVCVLDATSLQEIEDCTLALTDPREDEWPAAMDVVDACLTNFSGKCSCYDAIMACDGKEPTPNQIEECS